MDIANIVLNSLSATLLIVITILVSYFFKVFSSAKNEQVNTLKETIEKIERFSPPEFEKYFQASRNIYINRIDELQDHAKRLQNDFDEAMKEKDEEIDKLKSMLSESLQQQIDTSSATPSISASRFRSNLGFVNNELISLQNSIKDVFNIGECDSDYESFKRACRVAPDEGD